MSSPFRFNTIRVAHGDTEYIPQGHRFDIFEDVGCWPFTYDTWVAYLLVSTPPVLIGVISGVYAVLSIIAFNKSRTQFNELLSSHANLTSSRYIRLMCLAGIEVFCTVPFACWAIYLNASDHEINPWISFADTHWGFSRVDQFPSMLWRANPITETALELSRWLIVICAIIFFAFFGFADEARKNYRSAIQTISKHVGISSESFSATSSSGFSFSEDGIIKSKNFGSTGKIRPVPPVFVHQDIFHHRESIDSTMSISLGDFGGFLNEKKEDDKESRFAPTVSYGGITLNDVGSTLPDYCESPISPTPSSGPSSASSALSPSPAITRENSHCNIEISSLRCDSVPSSPVDKAHSPDVV